MRGRLFHRVQGRLLGAIVVAGALLVAHPASAQSDGDERCSKKGTARMFDALAKTWTETGRACVLSGPGAPVDGEKRCGFAGYVLKYEAKRGVWRSSQQHCDGSQPYIGWHQLD
jgi:hypothetical protein